MDGLSVGKDCEKMIELLVCTYIYGIECNKNADSIVGTYSTCQNEENNSYGHLYSQKKFCVLKSCSRSSTLMILNINHHKYAICILVI